MDLHLYLYDDGIGLMNRDWVPLIAALDATKGGNELAARLGPRVNPDPSAADISVEIAMERDEVALILATALDALDRKAAAAANTEAALQRVAAVEVAREEVALKR